MMKRTVIFLIIALVSCGGLYGQKNRQTNTSQKIPRVRFTGDPFAQMATAIFAETLQDMRNKIEYGANSKYPAGFFHTSTEEKGVPQYYEDMWSRDCGRGVIELCRLGFIDDAKMISRYFLAHKNFGDHWGRELHRSGAPHTGYELDGNTLIIAAVCNTWRVNGKDRALGQEFCQELKPVVDWVASSMETSPYYGLMPSSSELSGNPGPAFYVYSIFANYGMYTVLEQIADMAQHCGEVSLADKATSLQGKMKEALSHLISDGKFSYAPNGCWFNGFDGRDGRAYDISDWGGTLWHIWNWTSQLPIIQDNDNKTNRIEGALSEVNEASNELQRFWKSKG
ncbi:hypothetical protein AGMMS50239_41210 [Bacteroidia bacterium]|nr:hypothetical protein AGMMS50239_41210 [Bacteroidia bacterium]